MYSPLSIYSVTLDGDFFTVKYHLVIAVPMIIMYPMTLSQSGICPKMFLWNPIDQGKLSAFTLKALLDGKVSGKAGEKLPAGNMGEMVIQSADDGGTEIILGDPFPFDKSNIRMWRTIF